MQKSRTELQKLATQSNYIAFQIRGIESLIQSMLHKLQPTGDTPMKFCIMHNEVDKLSKQLIDKLIQLRKQHYKEAKSRLISIVEMKPPMEE